MDYLMDSSLQKLHALGKQYFDGVLPEYVKEASIASERPDANAPLSSYADPVKRRFPCHTKMATWLSSLYFLGGKYSGDKWDSSCPQDRVQSRLEKASKYWGILTDFIDMQSTVIEKSASPKRELTDDDYAMVVNYGDERVRRFPVINASTVKKAAVNILKKAMVFKVSDIPANVLDYVVKAAGAYMADRNHVATELRLRSLIYPDNLRDNMRKAADVVETKMPDNLDKLCMLLDGIDRSCKKYANYNGGLSMPEEVCYAGCTVKSASAEPVVKLVTGTEYGLETLKKAGLKPFSVLPTEYIEAIVANDKGDLDLEKVAQVLPTIPRPDAQLLEKSLQAIGIGPFQKEAARNLNKDFSMEGLMGLFGSPVEGNYSSSFRLRHEQSLQDELNKKAKKA
jgi:hypothetical protein